jgi:hypothetical protein
VEAPAAPAPAPPGAAGSPGGLVVVVVLGLATVVRGVVGRGAERTVVDDACTPATVWLSGGVPLGMPAITTPTSAPAARMSPGSQRRFIDV